MSVAVPRSAHHARHGFSLVEIAIVLAIVGLLLGVLITPLAMRIDLHRVQQTNATLDRLEQALIGFALSRGRLPCADTDDDGGEDRDASGACALGGTLPWQTLGTASTDAWGSVFRYRVSAEFTYAVGTGMPPAPERLDLHDTRGSITVLSHAGTPLAAAVPVVIVSTGAVRPPAGAHEAENVDGDDVFVLRAHTRPAGACDDDRATEPPCGFDDLVRWVSAPELLYRLVQAGRLP